MLWRFTFAMGFLTLFFSPSVAFCFGNGFLGETTLTVIQTDNYAGSIREKFSTTIPAGEISCCNYNNKQCNNEGTADALTVFVIYTNVAVNTVASGLQNIHLPSGGFSNIKGNPHFPTIERYDHIGHPFTYDETQLYDFSGDYDGHSMKEIKNM